MARRATVAKSEHTILVVDDQEETLLSVAALLQREGHAVITADSAEGALSLFRKHEIDLLLVDYIMPRVSGAELVRTIRGIDPLVQIILQTGYPGQQTPRAMVAGLDVQGYHDKAEGPEKLLLWIDTALKMSRVLKGRGHCEGALRSVASADSAAVHAQRSILAASACQELCNTLHAIRGYTEILGAELGANGTSADILERLERASDAALALAQDSLDLANPDVSGIVASVKGQRSTLH